MWSHLLSINFVLFLAAICWSFSSFTVASTRTSKRHKYTPIPRNTRPPLSNTVTGHPTSFPSSVASSKSSSLPSNQTSNTRTPTITPSSSPSSGPFSNYPSFSPSETFSSEPTKPQSVLQTLIPSHGSPALHSKEPSIQPTSLLSSSPSLSPISIPSSIPTTVKIKDNPTIRSCPISTDGHLIGNQTSFDQLIRYKYQMEYIANYTLDLIIDRLGSSINKAFVKESVFMKCTNSRKSDKFLKTQRQTSSVVGISSNPIDVVSDDESCPSGQEPSIGVECVIINGYFTLYLMKDSRRRLEVDKFTQEALDIVTEEMRNGGFTAAHEAIINLKVIDMNDGNTVVDDETNAINNSDKESLNTYAIVPSYAWILMAFGGVVLVGIAGFFRIRERREENEGSLALSSIDSLQDNRSLMIDEDISGSINTSNLLSSEETDEDASASMKVQCPDGSVMTDIKSINTANTANSPYPLKSDSGVSSSGNACCTAIIEKGQLWVEHINFMKHRLRR